ncbi:hypothetical protein LTR94_023849, partial [Friedmanniomyces endolithicus]
VVENYVKKGSTVYVEGALQTRKWTDQQGVEKYSTEIVVSRFKGELTMLGGSSSEGRPDPKPEQSAGNSDGYDLNDEVPF